MIDAKSLATAPGDTKYFDGRRATLNLSFGGGRDIGPTRVLPGEGQVKGVFAEQNDPPPGYTPQTNVTTWGFAVAGNGLYCGSITPTSCIWEHRACHATQPVARGNQSCELQ